MSTTVGFAASSVSVVATVLLISFLLFPKVRDSVFYLTLALPPILALAIPKGFQWAKSLRQQSRSAARPAWTSASSSISSILSVPSAGVLKMLLVTFLLRWGEAFYLPMLTENSRTAVSLLTLPSVRYSTRG